MTGPSRRIQVRDLALIVAAAAVLMALARSRLIDAFPLFALSSGFLAAVASLTMIRRAARMVRRDRGRRAATGLPGGLTPESLAAVALALATPVLCLVVLGWSYDYFHEVTDWLRREWRAITKTKAGRK